MKQHNATITVYFDTRKPKVNGKCPIKLTVYYNGLKKRYNSGLEVYPGDWIKINGPRLKDEDLREKKQKLNSLVKRAEEVIKSLEIFSFSKFEELFFKREIKKLNSNLSSFFFDYINELESKGQIGTAISYRSTINSLLNFKKGLVLEDITSSFLEKYETHMILQGKSQSTIGIYLRQLRAIINRAIKANQFNRENYPFLDYQIPSSRNVKKALSDEDLLKILNYQPSTPKQQKGYDLWIFSYLCNGMNVSDILYLKKENVEKDFFSFIRKKTSKTKKKDSTPIKVYLHPKAKEIIQRWSNSSSEFIFPFLDNNLTPKTCKHRIQKCIKFVNSNMEEIRVQLKIQQKIRTYEARHSFSTRLMRKGANIQFIKESLGHSSVTVTENYLGSFQDSVKRDYSALLTDFD